IRYQSPSTHKILGYAPEELIGRNVYVYLHPDDIPRVEKGRQQILAHGGASEPTELRFRHKDGTWCDLEGITNIRLTVAGSRCFSVRWRGITIRKRAEEERKQLLAGLSSSEARLRNVLTHANCFLWEATVAEILPNPGWNPRLFNPERGTTLQWN